MKRITIFLVAFTVAAQAQTLKDAQRLNDNEQYDAATEIYKKLIAREPSSGNLYYALGENLLDAGNADSALIAFNKGMQAEPGNALNQVGIARVKLYQGNLAEGKQHIEQAINATKSKNAVVLMEAGEAYTMYKAKDLMSAQTYLEAAVRLDPSNPDIYNALGDVYSELNNGTLAAGNYNKALDLDKNYTKALLHKGQLYKRSTNYEGAAVEFNNALAIDASFAPAYRELGEVYYLQRKLDKAKENYKKYLELSKNNNSARLRYASFLFQSANYPEAVAELQQISPVDSSNLGQMRLSAYLAHETNDTVNAVKLMNKVWDLTAADTAKRINRDYEYYGKVLARAGNDSLAGVYMWRSYMIDPSKTEVLNDIGQMYMKSKRFGEAVKAYEEKIRQGKNVTTTDYFNLGKAYYYNTEYARADSAFSKVTELQPAYAYGYFWRGRSNLQMDTEGLQGKANPHFEKFIETATTDTANVTKYRKDLVEAYGNIAVSFYNQKNYDSAAQYCRKLLEIDPENDNAKKILSNIRAIRENKQKKEKEKENQ